MRKTCCIHLKKLYLFLGFKGRIFVELGSFTSRLKAATELEVFQPSICQSFWSPSVAAGGGADEDKISKLSENVATTDQPTAARSRANARPVIKY